MEKRSYYINNPSSEIIRIVELNLSLLPGTVNLFELDPDLTYDKIEYSVKHGTLRAAIENGLCYPVSDPINKQSIVGDIIMRNPINVQVMPSRTRFAPILVQDAVMFDPVDSISLFGEEEIRPARELAQELNTSPENIEKIEATIKQANLLERPIENRYVVSGVKTKDGQQKIKNDMTMGYVTCEGRTQEGKSCMRRAKKDQVYCGFHSKQAK